MGNYEKSVIPLIESNYDNFTTVERNIADFFLHNSQQVDFSAKGISNLIYVSEASLSRFAQKCGFKGYREFIFLYKVHFSEQIEPVAGNTRMVLSTYQELLDKAYNLIDERQISRLIRYMTKAARVFVCGMGSSGLAAKEMMLRFMRIGVDIDAILDSDLMKMQAVFQNESSLVIGISISGESEEVLYLLQEAHKRKANTILFTAQNKDKLTEFCDEVVLVPSIRHLNHGNVISPQFPILVLLDICYFYFVEQNKFERETLHDKTLQALQGRDRDTGLHEQP